MGYANYKSELNLVATALGTDPTTYDTTIQTAPGILNPSLSTNTPYIDRIDLIVNKGKASALAPARWRRRSPTLCGVAVMGFVTLKTTDGRFITVHAKHCRREVNMAASTKAHLHRHWPSGATGIGQGAEGARPAGSERERCWYCGAPLGDPAA